MNKIWIAFICWSTGHDYTCKANEEIKPSKSEIEDGLEGFFRYARIYCKRCGHVHKEDQDIREIFIDLTTVLTKLRHEIKLQEKTK